MSLSKLNSFPMLRLNRIFVRFCNTEFKSRLGPSTVQNPYEDRSRRNTAPVVNVNKYSIAEAKEVIEEVQKVQEAAEIPHSSAAEIQKNDTAAQDILEKTKKFEKAPEPTSAVDELNSLKESLSKLEATAAASASSSSGSDEADHPSSAEEIEKRRQRMERNTRIGGIVLAAGSVIGFISYCLYYGRAKRDEAGNIIPDEHSGSFLAPFYRIGGSFKLWRDYVVEPAREQLLPDPLPAPYLQPKYTIVIELKNVMVHPEWTYKTGYRFLKRPALDYFLDVIGYPNFEVVIYSSESMMTAAPVVDSFDPKQRIMYKLFRDCTKYMNGHHVKDLSKLNRDLSKVIYIDYDAKSGQLNPENMLRIPEWKGNMEDTSLIDLAELLKTIHLSDEEDVRPMLQYYSQYDDPAKEFRRRAIYLSQQEEQKAQNTDNNSLLKRYSGKLFGFRRHTSA